MLHIVFLRKIIVLSDITVFHINAVQVTVSDINFIRDKMKKNVAVEINISKSACSSVTNTAIVCCFATNCSSYLSASCSSHMPSSDHNVVGTVLSVQRPIILSLSYQERGSLTGHFPLPQLILRILCHVSTKQHLER